MSTLPIRIELTTDQKDQIKQASGHDCEVLELKVEELEERIAPSAGPNLMGSCTSGSHFPTPSLP